MPASPAEAKRSPRKVYYGWVMVVVGCLINSIGSVNSAVSTVFFLPLTKELGLSRATLALALSLARLESGVVGPIAGWMLDKKGPRLTITLGAILGGVGLIILPRVHNFWTFLLVYMVVISVGFNLGFILSMHQVANLWFAKYRTRVLSFFSASIRLGTAISTPLLAYIVLRHGWKTGAVLSGIAVLVVVLPLSFLVKRSPEAIGQFPDGAKAPLKRTAGSGHTEAGSGSGGDLTFKQALKTVPYWIIVFSQTVRLSLGGAIRGQIIPIFVANGMAEQTGAWAAGLWSLIATPMILMLGYVGDRWSKKAILIAGQACTALAMLILVIAKDNVPLLGMFVVLIAFGESVAPVNHSIVGDFFGRKSFGRLNGMLSTFGTIGILAPPFLGWSYDRYQSYSLALFAFSAIAGMAVFLLLFLKRPKAQAPQPSPVEATATAAGPAAGSATNDGTADSAS